MAASPVPSSLVSLEEYLRTSYRPDMEYIDGELRLKEGKLTGDDVVQRAHSRLQVIVGAWFENHSTEWNILAGVEPRTRVSVSRVRLPDVAVVHNRPQTPTLTEPPLIAIEIVSPDDKVATLQARMRDLEAMGVKNLWIIDPQKRVARQYQNGAWLEVATLTVPESPIYLDVDALFAQLDA